jgi:RHS repeat-associated protein
LGNVLATITDKKVGIELGTTGTVDYFEPDVATANDYYPGGMNMPGRKYPAGGGLYRYGFNGKEKVNEIYGEGNAYDLGARMYSPRLGKMFSPDPREVEYPWQSTYAYFSNSPIAQLDFNGEGDYYGKDGKHLGSDGRTKTVGEGKDAKQVADNKAYTSSEDVIKKFTNKEGVVDWDAVQGNKVTTDLTTKYGLSNTDLLNRANWAYGEGGGEYLDHYAHTMNNLREHGPSGRKPYASDEAMFKTKMTHKSNGKIINMYPGYFNGTAGSPPAKKFAKARGDLTTLTNDLTMRAAIGSVIGSVMGTTKDPTGGAYQWVGGAGSGGGIFKYPEKNNAKNITNVTSGEGKAMRYHTFYEYINP